MHHSHETVTRSMVCRHEGGAKVDARTTSQGAAQIINSLFAAKGCPAFDPGLSSSGLAHFGGT